MERLGGMDSLFLSLESGTNLFHVGAVAIVDPSTAPSGSPPPYEGMRRVLHDRMHLLGPLRRRLAMVPGAIDHPRWVEDAELDLDNHVFRGVLPAPGGPDELATFVSRVMSTPLPRDRPLWEIHVVEGLDGDLVAGVAKIHHCAVDGLSSVELTAHLMDLAPEVPPAPKAVLRSSADEGPSNTDLVRSALGRIGRLAPAAVSTMAKGAVVAGRMGMRNRRAHTNPPPAPFRAPRTALSGRLSSQRSVALVHLDRDEIEGVRAATGTTFNDVLLTVTGAALRAFLTELGDLPARPLTAFVPVSVRDEADTAPVAANRLSGMIVGLATTIEDPVARLFAVQACLREARAQDEVLGPDMLSSLADLALPFLVGPAVGAFRRLGISGRFPMFNVVVSSYPGSPVPLYCAGGRMLAYHPFGPIVDGATLNVTAMSYLDGVGVGLLACRRAVPDLDELAGHFPDALTQLVKAACG
jgi:diacylglycerol O-acyltransferase